MSVSAVSLVTRIDNIAQPVDNLLSAMRGADAVPDLAPRVDEITDLSQKLAADLDSGVFTIPTDATGNIPAAIEESLGGSLAIGIQSSPEMAVADLRNGYSLMSLNLHQAIGLLS